MTPDTYNPFKDGFSVEPGQDGSLIVYGVASNAPRAYDSPRWGFTSPADFMRWLQKYEQPKQQTHQEPKQQTHQEQMQAARQRHEDAKRERREDKPIPLPAPPAEGTNGKRGRLPFFRG